MRPRQCPGCLQAYRAVQIQAYNAVLLQAYYAALIQAYYVLILELKGVALGLPPQLTGTPPQSIKLRRPFVPVQG
jgi:hypothetical protein